MVSFYLLNGSTLIKERRTEEEWRRYARHCGICVYVVEELRRKKW